MTFDNEPELHKIASHFPKARCVERESVGGKQPELFCFSSRLVIRIRADDPSAVVQLGVKFGCSLKEAFQMLDLAKSLALDVIGVRFVTTADTSTLLCLCITLPFVPLSFHVGSGCHTPDAYRLALEKAYRVFKYAVSFSLSLSLSHSLSLSVPPSLHMHFMFLLVVITNYLPSMSKPL